MTLSSRCLYCGRTGDHLPQCRRPATVGKVYFGDALTVEQCRKIVTEWAVPQKCYPGDLVFRVWRELSGVKTYILNSVERTKDFVLARQEYIGVMRSLTVLSYPEISRLIGKSGHSTLHQAYDRWCNNVPVRERSLLVATVAARIERMGVAV
jgi:hypothetical protein